MNRFRKLLLPTALVCGWIVIAAGTAAFLVERSGLLTRTLNEATAAALLTSGEELTIGNVSLDWFEPAVTLEGIRLEANGQSDVEVAKMRFIFAPWQGRVAGLERVEVESATLRLSPAFSKRMQKLFQQPAGEQQESQQTLLPSLVVNGLQVELEIEDWGNWPLGEANFRYSASSGTPAHLSGQLRPESWWAGEDAQDIQFHGSELEPGILELRTLARGMSLDLENMPEGISLESLRELHPSASLDLQVEGTLALDGSRPPHGIVRLALADGEMRAPDVDEPIRDLSLALEAVFAPAPDETPFDFEAWEGRAILDASWRETPVNIAARLGEFARADSHADVWLTVPEVNAPDEHIEEIIALLRPLEKTLRFVAYDLGARGRGELTVAMSLDRDWTPEAELSQHIHQLVHVEATGGAELTYSGSANENDERLFGFPVTVRDIYGHYLYSTDPSRVQPGLMGIANLSGNHGNGLVHCTGTLSSKLDRTDKTYPPLLMDLDITADKLAIDEKLHAATLGIRGVIPEDQLWDLYQPEGGSVDLDLRLVMEEGRSFFATHIGVDLDDVTFQWSPIRVPLRRTRGSVVFDGDGITGSALTLRVASELDTAEALDLEVRLTDSKTNGPRSHAEVQVHRLSLKGDDAQILAASQPAVKDALESFGPKGFVDMRVTWDVAGTDSEAQLIVDLAPQSPCEIDPQVFSMNTKDLRGRIIITAIRPPITLEESSSEPEWRANVRLIPLVGTWGAGIDVAMFGEFDSETPGKLALHGAGIRSSNRRLIASLAESIASASSSGTRIDLTSLTVDGRLDFGAELHFTQSEEETRINEASEFLVFLRENDIVGTKGFQLDRLDGRVLLNLDAGELEADRLDAVLGSTPVQLSNVSLRRVNGMLQLQTQLKAQALPLDREHLSLFMDADTLEALLDELGWRGTIDVHDAELVFESRQDGTTRLTLSGPTTLSDVFMQIGVPASIRSAQAYVNSLVFEGGKTRAWGQLFDLFGTVAGRSLESAEMLISFVEPRVSIENLKGHFIDSEGRVFPLGSGSGRDGDSPGGSAFAIDLRAPFPFEAAIGLENVDVDGLTQGLFAADIANSGRLQAEARLTGNLEELLDIRGSGFMSLTRGQLWSIPVVRTLFSRLGLDDSAVFDSMGIRFEISDGVIFMKELEAHSPILKLVGSGTLDFDGRLRHDLEVNYSLVDKLGFLRSFFYTIQNSLLRIAIRGDMERPEVILKSFFSDWQGEHETKALPLPDVSGLPRRF